GEKAKRKFKVHDQNIAPTITSFTAPGDLLVGDTASYSATASDPGGVVHYQWYVNNVAQAGATQSTFSFLPQKGYYFVSVQVTDNSTDPATNNVSQRAELAV